MPISTRVSMLAGFANPGRPDCVYYLAMEVSGDGHRRAVIRRSERP